MPTNIHYTRVYLTKQNSHPLIDSEALQSFNFAGSRAVAFRKFNTAGDLEDVINVGSGQTCRCQIATLNVPRGMRRVNNIRDKDPKTFDPTSLIKVTGQNTYTSVTLLDRLEIVPADYEDSGIFSQNYHSSNSKDLLSVPHKIRGEKRWGTIRPCAMKLDGGDASKHLYEGELDPSVDQRYITVMWDWEKGFPQSRFPNIRSRLLKFFNNLVDPVLMVGLIIPNRTVVWIPQPFSDSVLEAMHTYVWGFDKNREYSIKKVEYIQGANIFICGDFRPVIAPE